MPSTPCFALDIFTVTGTLRRVKICVPSSSRTTIPLSPDVDFAKLSFGRWAKKAVQNPTTPTWRNFRRGCWMCFMVCLLNKQGSHLIGKLSGNVSPLWPPLLVFFTNNISGGVLYLYLPLANTLFATRRSPASLVGEE